MTNLDTRLRAYAEHVAVTPPDMDEAMRSATDRSRPRPGSWLVIGAAAAVLVIVVAVTSTLVGASRGHSGQQAAAPQNPATQVAGRTWRLVDTSPHSSTIETWSGRPATLRIDGSQFSANDLCNGIAGSVSLTGDHIAFTSESSTLVGCPNPANPNSHPRATLIHFIDEALNSTVRWQIIGDRLTLTLKDGRSLTYQQQG